MSIAQLEPYFIAGAAGLMLAAVLSIVYYSWRNGISPMPSSAALRKAAAEELKRLPPAGKLVDAGSGWGTLALLAGKMQPGWKIVGIENSLIPMWISFLVAKLQHNANIAIIRGDLYTYSYSDVDMVVCYLYPGAMRRLSCILRAQLAEGSQVMSICFAMPDWEPERVIVCRDWYRTKIYIYRA